MASLTPCSTGMASADTKGVAMDPGLAKLSAVSSGADLVTGIAASGAVVTDTAVVGITVPGASNVTDKRALRCCEAPKCRL
jgi:hypothetical protein